MCTCIGLCASVFLNVCARNSACARLYVYIYVCIVCECRPISECMRVHVLVKFCVNAFMRLKKSTRGGQLSAFKNYLQHQLNTNFVV